MSNKKNESMYDKLIKDLQHTFANKINKLNIKQDEIAEKLNMTRSNVSMIVNGKAPITLKTICAFCENLEWDLHDIILGEDTHETLKKVRLMGLVEAGELLDAFPDENSNDTMLIGGLPNHKHTYIALKVKGESMNLIAPNGSYIYVDTQDTQLVNNGYYIIKQENMASFKKYVARFNAFCAVSTEDYEPIPAESNLIIQGRVRKIEKIL